MNPITTEFSKQRMFPGRIRCYDPAVVIKKKSRIGTDKFEETTIKGRFFRVSPQCWTEVLALQMMEGDHDKYTPAKDNGIIVSAEALAKLDAKF